MDALETLPLLLSGEPVPLAHWFAEPMTPVMARNWAPRIRHHVQRALHRAGSRFEFHLAELIVRHWCGYDAEPDYSRLLAMPIDAYEHAALELCYGQLLIAQRCQRAWSHLDRGFHQAAHLLEPEEYFQVLKRHELLRVLPLGPGFSEPAGLRTLLTEAGVIRELKGRTGRAMSV
jgi:hypothetical protein